MRVPAKANPNRARWALPGRMAFAGQPNLVAAKGAAGPDLMARITIGLDRDPPMRVLQAAEVMESHLIIPAFAAAALIPPPEAF